MLSSNHLSGNLPVSFAGLVNLTDFRINDNNFSGTIPIFIQNWKKLKRLEMHATGLEGPIPSNISLLNNLVELRISDLNGPTQGFPMLITMTGMIRLILRNCNISGELPAYLWTMKSLEVLDVSFNKLVGKIPDTISADRLRFVFLTGNLLSGDVPDSILRNGINVDLSYNNFAFQGPEQPVCQENLNLNLNMFRSSSMGNSSRRILPCKRTFSCPKYSNCLHVNAGGKDVIIKENKTTLSYEGDGQEEGGAAKYFLNEKSFWGFSSTGDFMDDYDYQNIRYTVSMQSSTLPELYSTARISPISLTYFHYCLQNGNYTVNLHFAEIQFTNDQTYKSLGRRVFDIYVQERLAWKNFNIEDEGGSAEKPLVKQLLNVSVTDNLLEIRFYFAGKGTTRIPDRGVYGPIISAISVFFRGKKKGTAYVVAGAVAAACLIATILGILWWRGNLPGKWCRKKDAEGLDFPKGTFSLKQIRAATDDFDASNKIGEGGFGPVYKVLDERSQLISHLEGYMAPEYALWGHLTYKADVYSFGVVALEIVSGKSNNNYLPSNRNCVCLIDWACHLQQSGSFMELVDEMLRSEINIKEAEIMVKVALMCTNASPTLRPAISEVVSMLEGRMAVPETVPALLYSDDLRFRALREHRQHEQRHSSSGSQKQGSNTIQMFGSSSTSFEISSEP
ncbi:hypothetical protein OIU78_000474 [Salix suchowensis]|nr:hypothetical protein OIU78_000474 [Salix suchowensis]